MAGDLTIRLQRGDVIVELQGDADTVRAAFTAMKSDGLGALAPFLGLGANIAGRVSAPTAVPGAAALIATPLAAPLTTPAASFQFVLDRLILPTNPNAFSSDVNGDGRPDNVFANVIIALQSGNFALQMQIDAALKAGQPIVLLTLATEFATPASDQRAAVTLFSGNPVKPSDRRYTIDASVPSVTLNGRIVGGRFISDDPLAGGTLVSRGIPLPFGPGAVADLPIQGLQLAFDVAVNGAKIPTGQFTGSLKQADVETMLLPTFAALMNDMLKNDPKSPVGKLFDTGGTVNPDGSVAQAGDGMIGISELLTNPLISTLLAPDVQIWDATGEKYSPNPLGGKPDSMSFGIGFSATAATY